jgi:inosine/xanthosine triphosphatase
VNIHVGSLNPAKVEAVSEMVKKYPLLENAFVSGKNVNSGVANQPMLLDETIQGAINRARKCFPGSTYGVGIEGGLVSIKYGGRERHMNVCAAAIFDGTRYYIGLSSLFELPPAVSIHINKGSNLNDAMYLSGLTNNLEIGKCQGAIGILTKGRLPRKAYTQQALMNAFIHLEHKDIYC